MRDNREKFNANMQYAVDQSNVQWRRQVNTADTAVQNETNRINTQNLFNASQNALNNLWQQYRDDAAWNFQKNESYLQRQHEVGIMAMEFANTKSLYNQQQKDELAAGIGNWLRCGTRIEGVVNMFGLKTALIMLGRAPLWAGVVNNRQVAQSLAQNMSVGSGRR